MRSTCRDGRPRLSSILLAGVLCTTAVSTAQSRYDRFGTQEELAAKRDDKLAAAFLKKHDWVTDYSRAREKARAEGKWIFAYFTRSYAP